MSLTTVKLFDAQNRRIGGFVIAELPMLKMNIDIIREAIEIPYISENHAAFANHILGPLQQQIKETIATNQAR